MNSDLESAKELLATGQYTCVLCKSGVTHTSANRGVRPLLELLDSGNSYQGYSAADKVVGKATAYLYVLLGVEAVYAQVISEIAIEVLQKYQIPVSWSIVVPAITNRTQTGFCPMESAVRAIDTPEEALDAVRAVLLKLQQEGK